VIAALLDDRTLISCEFSNTYIFWLVQNLKVYAKSNQRLNELIRKD